MGKESKDEAEKAIQDGRQLEALGLVFAAMENLPHESRIRVIASVAIMLDIDAELLRRLRSVTL